MVALAGCASSGPNAAPVPELTRVGEAVELTDNTTSVQECEYIADVPLEATVNENLLRNTTGELGANTVLLVRDRDGNVTRAEGYLCGD